VNRSFSLLFIAALASSVPFACTANLDESCIAGPCRATDTAASSSAASSGTGGSSGEGGAGGGGGSEPVCDPNDPNIPTTGEYPCDVFEVLKNNCFECHTDPPVKGAPFPLLKFEYTREMYGGKLKWELMKSDIKSGYMPFNKPADLMGADLKTMQDWFAKCAPPVPDGTGCEM
jgi:hypothetical protein